MSRLITLLLRVKLRQYLGHVGLSPRRVSSLAGVYLLWLTIIFLVAVMLRYAGILAGSGPQGFLRSISEVALTAVLAVGAFLGLKGGITALPYELDYVLTSTVRPRSYLLADLLFQLFLLTVFTLPPTALIFTVLTYPGHTPYLARAIPIYILAILMAVMLSHVLGVLRAVIGDRRVRIIGWGLLTAILSPLVFLSLHILPPAPLRLHPTSILASTLEGDPGSLLLAAPYLAALATAYTRLSSIDYYPSITPLLVSALMEPPTRLSKYIRLPPSLEGLLGLRGVEGLLPLMFRLHLLRILREGGLWTGMVVLLFLTIANMATPRLIGVAQFPEVAGLTMIALYTPLLPGLLSINWSISERPNIWVVNLSDGGERHYAAGLFLAYVALTLPFSLALYGVVSLGSGEAPFIYVDLILLAAMALFGSALAILTPFTTRLTPSPLSISSLLYIMVPLTGSILLSLPLILIRIYEPLASSPTPEIMANMAAYVVLTSATLYRIVAASGARYLR